MNDLNTSDAEALSDAMENKSTTAIQEKEEKNQDCKDTDRSPPEPVGKGGISHIQFMQLEELAEATNLPPKKLERMQNLKVCVEVELGRTKLPLEDILKLHQGSVVELDKLAGEPVDLLANGQLIARAEIVVIEDNFGVKILEIAGTKKKLSIMNK